MNPVMERFDRRMNLHRAIMRVGGVILTALGIVIVLLLWDAGMPR